MGLDFQLSFQPPFFLLTSSTGNVPWPQNINRQPSTLIYQNLSFLSESTGVCSTFTLTSSPVPSILTGLRHSCNEQPLDGHHPACSPHCSAACWCIFRKKCQPSTAVNRVLEVKGTRLLQCDQEIIIPGLNLSAKHCGKSLAASGSYIVTIVALCHSCCCADLYEWRSNEVIIIIYANIMLIS